MRRSEICRKKFWNNYFLKTIFFLRTKIYLHKSRTGGRRGEDFRIAQQIWRPPSAESRTPEHQEKRHKQDNSINVEWKAGASIFVDPDQLEQTELLWIGTVPYGSKSEKRQVIFSRIRNRLQKLKINKIIKS